MVRHEGRLPYEEGLALQADLVARRRAGEIPDTLLLLEHDPVVTLGRGADASHVLLDRDRLTRRGIAMFETGRGGDVTLHSPGQVVGYPVIALEGDRRDAHRYLRDLEEVMIRTAEDFGVSASRAGGLTGIWVRGEKLGAIGVRINSGWITSHGFAFNVSNDLGLFDVIVPCGIRGRGVTSLSRLLGRAIEPEEVLSRIATRFLETFGPYSTVGPMPSSPPDPRSSRLGPRHRSVRALAMTGQAADAAARPLDSGSRSSSGHS